MKQEDEAPTAMDSKTADVFEKMCNAFIRTVLVDCQRARLNAGNDTDGVMPDIVAEMQKNNDASDLQMHMTVAIAALNRAITLACDSLALNDGCTPEQYLYELAGLKAEHIIKPKDGTDGHA